MINNMIILSPLQIATTYGGTFQQPFAVRALFGLFMSGVDGHAAAMALQNCQSKLTKSLSCPRDTS